MPQQAIVDGCEDIASQLINYNVNLEARFAGVKTDGIEVVLGGGRRYFLPAPSENSVPELESNHSGKRTDGRNLIAEWQAVYPDGIYVEDSFELNALATEDAKQVLGLFNPSHLRYETDRAAKQAPEPSLQAMTAQAIAILDNNPRGFLLVVEAARIDHAHHAGNAYNALSDTIELSKAVKTAIENTDPKDTLIIATADHGHVFTMAGYPKRGNPILGKVVAVDEMEPTLAADNLPYTTLGYAIGRGHRHLGTETNADMAYRSAINAGRKDLRGLDTTQPGFYQEVLIPNQAETHSGEDVPIYAIGPGAHLITGSHEQTVIFHAVNYAAGLSAKARAALR
jgi:alkaline phosphatase